MWVKKLVQKSDLKALNLKRFSPVSYRGVFEIKLHSSDEIRTHAAVQMSFTERLLASLLARVLTDVLAARTTPLNMVENDSEFAGR